MPNRTAGERDKFDHSSHPTTHRTEQDLHAPGGGTKEKPENPNDPAGEDSSARSTSRR